MKKIVNDLTARPVADSPLSYDEALDHCGLMHLSEAFNTRLQNYYKTEFNLANRLRKIKQTKANLKEFVKKTPYPHAEYIIGLLEIEETITETLLRETKLVCLPNTEPDLPNLRWTATINDLVELLYALFHNKSFNNGNVQLRDIAVCFERLFQVKLGNLYLKFSKVRNRKKERAAFTKKLYGILIDSMDVMDN